MGDFKDTDGTVYVPRVSSDPVSTRSEYVYVTNKNLTKYQIFTALEERRDSEWKSGIGINCAAERSAFLSCNFGVKSANTTLAEQLNE